MLGQLLKIIVVVTYMVIIPLTCFAVLFFRVMGLAQVRLSVFGGMVLSSVGVCIPPDCLC